MSTNWGLALDAEVAYRHEQIRSDFLRPWRRSARRTGAPEAAAPTANTEAPLATPLRVVEPTTQAVGLGSRQQSAASEQVRAA
jgi:transposase-like protein